MFMATVKEWNSRQNCLQMQSGKFVTLVNESNCFKNIFLGQCFRTTMRIDSIIKKHLEAVSQRCFPQSPSFPHDMAGPFVAVYCVQKSYIITCHFSKYFQIL